MCYTHPDQEHKTMSEKIQDPQTNQNTEKIQGSEPDSVTYLTVLPDDESPNVTVEIFAQQSLDSFGPQDPMFMLFGAFGSPDDPPSDIAGNKHQYLADTDTESKN